MTLDAAPQSWPCAATTCHRELRAWELDAHMLICSPCLNRMRAQLTAIPAALIVLREGSMHRERTGTTGGRGGTRTAPLPCRTDVLNLVGPAASGTVRDPYGDQVGQRPLVGVLGDWVRLVCEERRLNGPDSWTEVALADWLIPQLGFASTQPWVAELAGELSVLMWQIRAIAQIEVRTVPISRPCPRESCGMLTLTRTDWDLYVRCSSCGGCWTPAELNDDAAGRAHSAAA